MDPSTESLMAIVKSIQEAGLTMSIADSRQVGTDKAVSHGLRKASSAVQTCGRPQSAADMLTPKVCQLPPHSAPSPHVHKVHKHQIAETPYSTSGAHQARSSRITDAFAESLRKYPRSTERCTSADLINHLLTYTQNKNLTKSSYHSKSHRFLRKQPQETPKENIPRKRSSKNIQTYVRNRQMSPTSSLYLELSSIYGKTERRRRLVSPAKSDKGNISSPTRQRSEQLSASYDYLKIGSSKFTTRSTDVRYLNDVTRYVKDTLRIIYDDQTKPQMCPRIASRYSQHRREHHQADNGTTTSADAKTDKVQTPAQTRASNLSPCSIPGTSACQRTRDMFKNNVIRRICRICQQPLPCECLDSSPPSPREMNRLKSLDLARELLCRMCGSDDDDDCVCLEKIRVIIDEWLKEVPIYANYTRKEEADREDIINGLKARIRLFIDDEENCKKEIIKCLNKLPMWLPSEQGDRQEFKDNLTSKLWHMLRNGRSKERIEEIVREWLNTVPFKSRPPVDKDRLVYDLTGKLTNVFATSKIGELNGALKETVFTELNKLPILCECYDRDTVLPQLEEKLVNTLLFEKINDDVRGWISNIPFKPTPPIDKERLILDLTKILKDIIETSDPDMVREHLEKAISEQVSKLPVNCDAAEKDTYYPMLVDQLLDRLTRDKLSQSVRDWIDTIPFKSWPKIDKEKLSVDLTKNLRNIIDINGAVELKSIVKKALIEELMELPVDCDPSGRNDFFADLAEPLANTIANDEIHYVIRKWIKHIPFMTPPPVDKNKLITDLTRKLKELIATTDPETLKESLEQTLLGELSMWPINISKFNDYLPGLVSILVDDLTKDKFSQTVRKWVYSIPVKPEEQVEKYFFACDLTKKLKDVVAKVHPDEVEDALKDVLLSELEEYPVDCDPAETEEYFSTLADTLINNLAVDRTGQTIRNWIKAIPFKASPPVDIEKLAVNLTKQLKQVMAMTGPQELKETLKLILVERLRKLPIDCDPLEKENYITEITENLADTLADNEMNVAVSKWVNTLSFDPTSRVNSEEITTNLTNKLKDIVEEVAPDELRPALENAVLEELLILPIDCDPELKEKHFLIVAEKLVDTIMKDNLGDTVHDWLNNIPLLPDSAVDKDQLATEITRKLRDIITTNGPQDLKNALKEALLTELEKLPIDCDPKEKEELSLSLADKLAEDIVNQKISKVIQTWVQTIPFKSTSDNDKETIHKGLINKFKNILSMVDPTEVRDALKGAALQELLGLPIDCDPLEKDKYLPQLADKVADDLSKDIFGQTVRDWIDNVPFDPNFPMNKKEFTNNLLQSLRSAYCKTEPHERKNILRKIILDNLTNVALECDEAKAETLANNLADQLVKLHKRIQLPLSPDEEAQMLAWLKQQPGFANMTDEEIKRCIKEMGATYRDLLAQGLSPDEIAKIMQENAKQCAAKFRKKHDKPFSFNVTDILKNIGPTLSNEESKKLVKEVVKKLRELREGGTEESLVHDNIKKQIEEGVRKIYADRGEEAPDDTVKGVAKSFYKQLFKTSSNETPRQKQLAQKLQNKIQNWLQDSPELGTVKKNKKLAEYMADKLANTQLTGIDDRLIKENMLKDIKNILANEDKTLEPKTAEKLAESLFDKLKGTLTDKGKFSTTSSASSSNPTTSVTPNTTAASPSSSSDKKKTEPSPGTQKQIKDWVENIPALTSKTPAEMKANENLVQQITTKIGRLQTQGLDNNQIKRQIASELDSALTSRGKTLDSETKNKLIDQLLNKLPSPTTKTTSSSAEKSDKKTGSPDVVQKEISNWIQQIPTLASKTPAEKKEIENIVQGLTRKLFKVNEQNLGDKESRQNMLNAVKDTLDTALKNKGIKMDSKEKLNLANNLIDKLQEGIRRNTSTVSFTEEPEPELSQAFRGTIEDFIEKSPTLQADTNTDKKKNKKLIRNLGKTLSKLYEENKNDPQIQNKMMNEINTTLDSLLERKDKKLDQNTKSDIANILLSNILGTAAKVEPRSEKKQETKASQRSAPTAQEKDKMLKEIQDQYDTALKTRSEYIELKAKNELKGHLVDDVFELEKLDNKLKENIKTLLQELPEVFSGSPADMKILDEISTSLANDLKNILPDQLRDDPESKRQVLKGIKEQLINKFEKKGGLDSKTAKVLAEKILDNTNDLLKTIACKAELLKTMQKDKDPNAVRTAYMVSGGRKEHGSGSKAKDLADVINTLTEKVNVWFENIPELKSTSPYEKEKNTKMSIALATELGELLSKDPDNPQVQDEMLVKIKNVLQSALDERGVQLEPKAKMQLAEKLLHQVLEVFKRSVKKRYFIDWEEQISDLSSGSSSETEHSNKVRDWQALDKSENELYANVKNTVGDHLKSEQYYNSINDNLVFKLLYQLADIIVESDVNEPSNVIQKTFSSWITRFPELADIFCQTNQGDLFSSELVKNATKLLSEEIHDKEIRWQVFKEIKCHLDIMLGDNGKKIDYRTKHQMAEYFFNNILESAKRNNKIKRKLQISFESDAKMWIEKFLSLYTRIFTEGANVKDNYLLKNKDLQSKGVEKNAVRDEILQDIIGQTSCSFNDNNELLNSNSRRRFQTDSLLNREVHSVKTTDHNIIYNLSQVFQGNVSAWLREIPEIAVATTTMEKREIQKIIYALAKKLSALYQKGVDKKEVHQEMIEEIKDHLDDILDETREYITNKNKTKLADKLIVQLVHTAKATTNEKTQRFKSEQVILNKSEDKESQWNFLWEWFNNIPVSFGNKDSNVRMVDILNDKLLNVQSMQVNNEVKKEIMEKEIRNWLDDTCILKNKRLNRKTKDKVIKNLINIINKSHARNRTSSTEDANSSNLMSWNLNADNTDFPIQVNQHREEDSFNDKYRIDMNIITNGIPRKCSVKECVPISLTNTNDSKADINSKQTNRLKTRTSKHKMLSSQFANNSGKGRYPKSKGRSSKTSINECYDVRRPSTYFTTEEPEVYYLEKSSGSNDKTRKRLNDQASRSNLAMVKSMSMKDLSKPIDDDTQEKITSIIRLNIDKMNTPESAEVRQELLDVLLNEVGLPSSEAEELVDSIIRRAEIQAIDAGNAELQLLAFIRDEIAEFIAEFKIKKEHQLELEAYLVELVTEKLLKGTLDAETRKEVLAKVAAKGGLTMEEAEDLLDKLIGETQFMMSSPAISKSLSRLEHGNRTHRSSLTLKEQTNFERNARIIITNFIYDYTRDPSDQQKDTIRMVVEDAIKNLEEILTDTDLDGLEKRRQMVKECERQLGKLTLDSNKPLPDLAEELMDRLESINLKTSTPKNSAMDGSGLASHLKDKGRRPSQLKDDYSKKLELVIKDWLEELPIDPDTLNDKQFKNNMIWDLAGNIADREYFLQMNPDSKSTEADELEHLNYECNKWLNKFLEGDDLNIAKSRVPKLIAAIKNVAVPDMVSNKQNQTYEDALKDEIMKWAIALPPDVEPTVNMHKMEQLAETLARRIKKHKGLSDAEEKIRSEIAEILPSMFGNEDRGGLKRLESSLFHALDKKGFVDDTWAPTSNKAPEGADLLTIKVYDWIKSLPIDAKTQEEKKQLEEAKKDFVTRLKQVRQQYHPASAQHEKAVRDEAKKFMKENITDVDKKIDGNYLDTKASELINLLKNVPIEGADAKKSNKTLKHPADLLYRYIEEWCGDLPVTGEPDKVQSIKQNLASRLINKIGELNMDPDIFNDDVLYEDLLHDEVDILLEEVPRNPELDKYLPALKKDLISKIMEARQILRNELVGKAYKQQLREVVSTSMHLPKSLPLDEKAALEILKDKVADAFINLNYSSDGECRKMKYKNKISDEIDKFCDEILHNYPCAHLDPNKIKRELFSALLMVSVPKDDTMKSEVEQTRMKDIINDWMKELPLRQESSSEKLLRYKLASILVKRLHDMELEKEIDPYLDGDPKMSEDIGKFLGKLPIQYDQEDRIPIFIQNLLDKLKNSEQSRKFISARRSKSIETQSDVCNKYPCTLNQKDKDHLKRIKERVGKRCFKDQYVTPMHADSTCQTDSRDQCWSQPRSCSILKPQPKGENPCFVTVQKKDASCVVRIPTPCYYPPPHSPCHMPNVIVKEYMWDSTDTCKFPQTCSQSPNIQSGVLDEPTESSKRLSKVQTEEFQQQNVQPEAVAQAESKCQTQPILQTSRPCMCRPHQIEKEVPCSNTKHNATDYVTPEPSSADEAGPTTSKAFWRDRAESMESVPPCPKECKHNRPPKTKCQAKDQDSDWQGPRFDDEDFWDTCWQHRGRRTEMPHTKRRERMQEKVKCKCKERILVSCRGPNSRNRYHDMCQSCGSSCPHPSYMYFK